MRVVVLGSYAPSLINFRGQLIADMVRAGHAVIACAPGNDAAVATALGERGATYQPVPLQRTGLNPLADARSMVELARMLRRLRPDLLFAYTSKPVIYGTIAARLARVPRVFAMISGLGYAFTGSGELARRLTRQVTSALYRASLRATDGVFFQNPDDLDEFRRRAIVSDRQKLFRINGSGVDTTHYRCSAPPLEPPTFLMIARLLRDKGIYEYVQAAR
ncbi:MAG TPA: glycosyltransferase, partial [Geminicoccaceae bacterium]|nr:glycosyltransferase [Geminicoccaceae bacterium]